MRLEDYLGRKKKFYKRCPKCLRRRHNLKDFFKHHRHCKRCKSQFKDIYDSTIGIKKKAHALCQSARKEGTLTPPGNCPYCTKYNSLHRPYTIVAHHCDYSRPLDVLWMCTVHHQAWHRVLVAKC